MLPVPYTREATVYYSRWNASERGLGSVLWLAGSRYAISRGAVYSSATGKEDMRAHYQKSFGCMWHPIEGASLRKDAVGKSEDGYFLASQPPRPWLGIIKEQIWLLPEIAKRICADSAIEVAM